MTYIKINPSSTPQVNDERRGRRKGAKIQWRNYWKHSKI